MGRWLPNPVIFHRIMAWVWLAMLAPTLLWWRDSVLWVASMSLYANVASEFAAAQASALSDEDIKRIVDALKQEGIPTPHPSGGGGTTNIEG